MDLRNAALQLSNGEQNLSLARLKLLGRISKYAGPELAFQAAIRHFPSNHPLLTVFKARSAVRPKPDEAHGHIRNAAVQPKTPSERAKHFKASRRSMTFNQSRPSALRSSRILSYV